jgi:protein SDA1
LAYTVQACHPYVPPEEVYVLLKTIAHNFITERCSEEQMAVGINAARAICARVPSVMSQDEAKDCKEVAMDMEAFARDLAGFCNHRDRSVATAGKTWTNFVREVNPTLLAGKDRGLLGTALARAGTKPLRYGEHRVAAGVEGADLLVEYEARKAAQKAKRQQSEDEELEGDDNDEWREVADDEVSEDSDDDSAPNLVLLDGEQTAKQEDSALDLAKMSAEERELLKQQVSSTRVFSAADFEKMRKLVEREQRAKRDPREAARRKRAIARGQEFEELSGDDSSDSESDEEDRLRVSGVVNPEDIMGVASRKRQSKAERLQKVIAGRQQFESKQREGGSTNVEKKRKKNFLMSKFSRDLQCKAREKGGLNKKRGRKKQLGHEAKKRRRKA